MQATKSLGVLRVSAPRMGLFHTTAAAHTRNQSPFHTAAAAHTRNLFHTAAAARASKQTVADAVPEVPNFDPTLPGRVLAPWHKFRGYLSFYKEGVKTLWAHRQTYARVKRGGQLTRSELQILTWYPGDRLRVVPFGVLAFLAPELIYVIVVFLPGICPSTCVTYKTVAKGAAKHDRVKNRLHLRALDRIEECGLSAGDFASEAALARAACRGSGIFAWDGLRRADLLLFHRFLRMGSMLAMVLPTPWLRSRVQARLEYICKDDSLLLSEQLVGRLGLVELFRACQERGIPAADLPEYQLRQALYNWARLTQRQAGAAGILPIAWSRLALLNRSVKLGSSA